MPKWKCLEDDAWDALVDAILRDRKVFKTRKDLVDFFMKKCGYDHVASAYRLVKKFESRGSLKHVPGLGYVLQGENHTKIIVRTCALLLDLIKPLKPVHEILREGFAKYYGEEEPGVIVLRYMRDTVEHVVTSDEELARKVMEGGDVDELLPHLITAATEFFINAATSGTLTGWCEACGGSLLDSRISTFAEMFVETKIKDLIKRSWRERYVRGVRGEGQEAVGGEG
jgi:hypothetical protein